MTATVPPPDTRDLATCKRCKATIRFVYLANGRRVTAEVEPTDDGRLIAEYEAASGFYVLGYFAARGEWVAFGLTRFAPHSDTCGRLHERHQPPADAIAEIRAALAAAKASAA